MDFKRVSKIQISVNDNMKNSFNSRKSSNDTSRLSYSKDESNPFEVVQENEGNKEELLSDERPCLYSMINQEKSTLAGIRHTKDQDDQMI